MKNIITMLKEDEEVQELRKRCHELNGEWIPYHWDCFGSIDEYKEYMKKKIKDNISENDK